MLARTASADERYRSAQLRRELMEVERATIAAERELAATQRAIDQVVAGQDHAAMAWNGADIFGCPAPALTQLSFGDGLGHPITVHAADFDCLALPQQECALVRATFKVVNDSVGGDKVKATLKFPLPDGAVVCGLQFQVGQQMVDAFAVTKKKAASVAHKEKEKGCKKGVACMEVLPTAGGDDDEEYEDSYVILDLPDVLPTFLASCESYQLIGLGTATPFLKLGTAVLKGCYEENLGTDLVFSEDATLKALPGSYQLPAADPGLGIAVQSSGPCPFELVATTTHKIRFERVLLEPISSDEPVP